MKTTLADKTLRYSTFLVSLCFVLVSPVLFSTTTRAQEGHASKSCDGDAPDAKDVNVQATYRILEGTSEDLVIRIVKKYKPTDPEYKEAQTLYREAQKNFNAYFEAALLQMVQQQKGDLTPTARNACEAGNKFAQYVMDHTESRSFAAILPVVKTLIDYAIGYYDQHKEKKLARRKAIADALRPQILWKSWADIVKANS